MTKTSPWRSLSVRARMLSVTGIAVLASVLIWHAQLAEFVGLGSAGDDEPVVAGAGGPGSTPPSADVVITPSTAPPTTRRPPRRPSTPRTKKTEGTEPSYDESSLEGLSPILRSRLEKAIAAAEQQGVRITITSGRRSAAKQRQLLREAIERYGSYRAATRWVLPPEDSAHVKGTAVDVGPAVAQQWLNKNGWRYGICRRYDNEPWHFEALTKPGRECPPREPYAVASSN